MKEGGKEGRKEKRKEGRERRQILLGGLDSGPWPWSFPGSPTTFPPPSHPLPTPNFYKGLWDPSHPPAFCRIGEEQGCFHSLRLAVCWPGWQWGLVPGLYLFWWSCRLWQRPAGLPSFSGSLVGSTDVIILIYDSSQPPSPAPVPDRSNSPLDRNGWEKCQFASVLYILLLDRMGLQE